MNTSKSLNDIIKFYGNNRILAERKFKKGEWTLDQMTHQETEALKLAHAAIVEAVEGLIGPDEPNPRNGSEWTYGFEYRNKLRAEQRIKLAKLKGSHED